MKTAVKTRLFSWLICVAMLVGLLPTTVFAAGSTPVTTDKVYTYQKIDSVDDIVPGKHFIIVAEYTNETTGETSYHALGAKMAFYDGFRYAYQQDDDEYYGVGKTFTISADKNTITTYYNDTNYAHNYANDYSKNEPEHGILRLRFEPYDLTKNQYKFAVDGHGYMFGFTSRGNDGAAGHHYHAKMPIGTSTSGAPWWQLSVGSNGYWQICTQTTYGSYNGRITGFERIQSYIYPHHGIAATGVSGNSIETFAEANTGILLYMETGCHHYIDTLTHIEGKSATCSAPGIKECWYCSDCETYFADEALSEEMAVEELFVAALPHTASCGHDKETGRFELCFDTPNGSNESGERYLLIGKAGDKYYAMGNVTNADGSRNAVEVVPNENGIIAADSDQAEFLTYIWPDSGAIGYFADGGYFSVYNGKLLAYNTALCNASKYIPNPADFRIEDYDTGSGNFGVYSYLTKKSEYIGFDAATLTFKGVSEADESTYLYCELCPHENMEHVLGTPATCTQQGTIEYWYCEDCYGYYLDGNFEVSVTINNETLFALGHKYNSEGVCENCGMNRHVYRPVTSLAQFDQLSEDASYIIVFKDGSKTYAAYLPGENPYWLDRNFDWEYDLFVVDENENGIPDCIETVDLDENGVLDYMEDQNSDEEIGTYDDYFWVYDALAYAKDEELHAASNFVEVTIAADGSITIIDEGAMEFQLMEAGVWGGQLFDKEMFEYDKEWYGIQETDRMRAMWVPNYWIANGGMMGYYGEDHFMTQERRYGDDAYPGVMDNKNWKINFTGDGTVNFVSSWSDLPDSGALQLVKYGDGKMTMVGLSQDMWNDSEIMISATAKLPAYLYASEAVYSEPPHVCDFGEWTDDANGKTHTRTCADPACGKTETVSHAWDDGAVTKAPTCTADGVMTFTCADCGAVKTETMEKLGHDWGEWTDDGENADTDTHTRSCRRDGCAAAEQIVHSWGDWVANGESGHKKTCPVCSGTRAEGHEWDDGVVTVKPTHLTEGEKLYTCGDCGQTRTETIAKTTDHEWSNWVDNGDGTHSRTCPCGETESENCAWDNGVVTKEPTHLTEGEKTYTCTVCGAERTEPMAKTDAHEWSSWGVAGNGTHTRFCPCGETESENCVYDDGTVIHQPTHTEKGTIEYCCTVCGHFYEEELPVLTDHAWGEWVVNKEDEKNTHIRFCVCNEFQTAPHSFDGGKVTVEATHLAEGEKTYTCIDCGYAYTESIAKLADHEWGEWVDGGDGTHSRTCPCGENEIAAHIWSEWTELAAGGYQRLCAVCGAVEKLVIDTPVNTTPDDNAAGTVLSDSDLALIDKILTDEEKSQIAQGAEVKIYLLVEDISDAVPADHKAEAEAKAGGDAIGMYLDLLLFKQVGDDEAVAISETNDELVITFTVPEELRNSDPAVKRTYQIVRVHEAADGSLVTDVIEGVFNAEDNSFTFATDKFSTYALTYADSKVSSPVTGDGSMLWLLTAAIFISVCGVAAVVYGKRRYTAK